MTENPTVTGAELVQIGSPDEIAELPPQQRGELITHALVESKQWLAVATKGTDPTPVAEFKAWAATVAEMTRQKGLAKEIQLDAQEMVRRAERGIGLTIRNGQATGDIQPNGGDRRSDETRYPDEKSERPMASTDFLRPGNEMTQTYDLTDGVTDEQFEEALEDAREEGNVSRANVIRKVEGKKSPQEATLERRKRIREMAAENYTSRQIAETVGMRIDSLGKLVKQLGISIPADGVVGRKSRRIDPDRVISETVAGLEGLCMGVALLDQDQIHACDPEQVAEWARSLAGSIKTLTWLRKELNHARP